MAKFKEIRVKNVDGANENAFISDISEFSRADWVCKLCGRKYDRISDAVRHIKLFHKYQEVEHE